MNETEIYDILDKRKYSFGNTSNTVGYAPHYYKTRGKLTSSIFLFDGHIQILLFEKEENVLSSKQLNFHDMSEKQVTDMVETFEKLLKYI